MKFRELYPKEREILRKEGKEYGLNIDTVLKGKKILKAKDRRDVFILNKQTFKILKKIKKDPYCVGMSIGEIRKGKFEFGLEGGTFIAPYARNKVVVDKKGEQLVLYGRDIFHSSVIKGKKLKEGDKCVVVNEIGEAIALGKVMKNRVFVKNLKDKGLYLRRGE
jgi:ribosome biogenesis protein Nip4